MTLSAVRCPGAAHDDVNAVQGSLPIEVAQGRRRTLANVTSYTSTLQLRLALTVDDFNQQRGAIVQRLSGLYGRPVSLELQAGSVVVNVIGSPNTSGPYLLSAFSAEELSDELQLSTEVLSEPAEEAITLQIPVDDEWYTRLQLELRVLVAS